MYKLRSSKKTQRGQIWLLAAAIAVVLVIAGVAGLRIWYGNNLKPVAANSTGVAYFTVPSGSTLSQIATSLHQAGLIRSVQAFETYVRSSEVHDNLQAGTYSLSKSMSVQKIVQKMVAGDVAKDLLTILPGKRLDEIKKTFKNSGYSQAEVDAAFSPAQYTGHPALASLPAGASLEGYLYPDSFQKITGTPASTIVRESLDEMAKHLTPDIINSLANRGLNPYQGITLASIVYQETDDASAQPTVAQVFLTRMAQGMALQSNVTANYAADLAGVPRNVGIDSTYNTYLHTGLPPGPIGNFVIPALKAVAHPSSTDYLYFIAGDDNKMHFSRTQAEHDQAIKDFCTKKCAQ